jgi:uncharacterized membrane-anchored protein YhcB (DUF1043 family)
MCWLWFVVGLVVGAVIGALLYRAVFNPLEPPPGPTG